MCGLERICTYQKKRRHIAMIKRIEILDKAAEVGTKWRDIPCNMRFGDAYFYSLEAGNDLINFGDVIWDYDIDEILENCRRLVRSMTAHRRQKVIMSGHCGTLISRLRKAMSLASLAAMAQERALC